MEIPLAKGATNGTFTQSVGGLIALQLNLDQCDRAFSAVCRAALTNLLKPPQENARTTALSAAPSGRANISVIVKWLQPGAEISSTNSPRVRRQAA